LTASKNDIRKPHRVNNQKYLKESLLEFEALPDFGGGLNNGEGLELPLVRLELFLLICSNESKKDSEDAVFEDVSNTRNGSL
jgi:hypothetical protein